MVSDKVVSSALILPAGTTVPLWDDDEAQHTRLLEATALPTILEPRQGFLNGQRVDWWDLGPASPTPIPGYMLVEEREDGYFPGPDGRVFAPLMEHPVVFNLIPGDLGYSPLWTIVLVPVTDRYQGELLTSVEAIDEAEQLGLVEPGVATPLVSNCPVVTADTRLRRTPGGPLEEPYPAYYHGQIVHLFVFDAIPLLADSAPVQSQLTLRRAGGEPLSEPIRGVDMTGDGDATDTNDIFTLAPTEPGFSDLVRVVDVVVPADMRSIDTYEDESHSDIEADEDLFSEVDGVRQWNRATVLAAYEQPTIYNRPFTIRPAPTP